MYFAVRKLLTASVLYFEYSFGRPFQCSRLIHRRTCKQPHRYLHGYFHLYYLQCTWRLQAFSACFEQCKELSGIAPWVMNPTDIEEARAKRICRGPLQWGPCAEMGVVAADCDRSQCECKRNFSYASADTGKGGAIYSQRCHGPPARIRELQWKRTNSLLWNTSASHYLREAFGDHTNIPTDFSNWFETLIA